LAARNQPVAESGPELSAIQDRGDLAVPRLNRAESVTDVNNLCHSMALISQ
jgi:hypothetical protein